MSTDETAPAEAQPAHQVDPEPQAPAPNAPPPPAGEKPFAYPDVGYAEIREGVDPNYGIRKESEAAPPKPADEDNGLLKA